GGPDRGCMDIIDHPDEVKEAMEVLFKAWKKVYDDYWAIVKDKQKGSTSWIGVWAPGKMYPVQNDLSCLVSPSVYKEFFLEELLWEIKYLDYSIYHLDGVEALQHLDILLDIPELNAIQWVSGARFEKENIERWIPLYKKIQAKKKAIVVYPKIEEIETVLENLKPEGLLIQVGCSSQEEAERVCKKLGW
ncbi:MAG: trimethylamine corrinoid protein 2, partial [Candidatus Omnitrophica bacterium]|nr:trimethylamine corrinoid protein 2 [Candidatus Omnitrophota bacterium]